jgi:putative transposase
LLLITNICRLFRKASCFRSAGPAWRVACGESELTLLMRLIDEQVLETPVYGAPRMMRHLRRHGQRVGGHRAWRLMRRMGLAAVYQKSRTSAPHPKHVVYPYLLRDLTIDRPNQV